MHDTLSWLQQAVYFRNVSKAPDEALCLSTLCTFDHDTRCHIASAKDHQTRMARLWHSISTDPRFGGVPARVVFFEDETLTKPGYQWAPRSLLGAAAARSWFDESPKTTRWHSAGAVNLGECTARGLRVRFPGWRIEVRALVPGLKLHPWRGVLRNPLEDMVYLKHEKTGRWLRAVDWKQSQKSQKLPEDQWTRWYQKDPICRAIDKGNCALIRDNLTAISGGDAFGWGLHSCLMVSLEDPEAAREPVDGELCVHKKRTLLVHSLSKPEAVVASGLQALAMRLATEKVTIALAAITNKRGKRYTAALDDVKRRMKEVMGDYLEENLDFAKAVDQTLPGIRQSVWAAIPKFFSHNAYVVDLPDSQCWVVD